MTKVDAIYISAELLSIAVAVGFCLYAWWGNKTGKRRNKLMNATQLSTAGVFLSACLQYVPIFLLMKDPNGQGIDFPVAQAVLQAAHVFTLDADLEVVRKALSVCTGWVGKACLAYCMLYCLVTPVLTVGFILSFFRGAASQLRYSVSLHSPLYVLSRLNPQSLALARSIRQQTQKTGQKALIVFADAFENKSAEEQDLRSEASENTIGAILLKKDVAHLNYSRRKAPVKIFLIDSDESANVENALKLAEIYHSEENELHAPLKIYVYAQSSGSGLVIDSVDKGYDRLMESLRNSKEKTRIIKKSEDGAKTKELPYPEQWGTKMVDFLSEGFQMVRIDTVSMMAMELFRKSDIFHMAEENKCISILIIGMGSVGREILKTALWYCQMAGYTLEINVIDKGVDRKGHPRDIRKILSHECPEIMKMNPNNTDGDANYNIRFFDTVDCFTSAFDDLFMNQETAQVLGKTQIAFVALGNDDMDIEASINLRQQFDRLCGLDSVPSIYSVVLDDQKAANLNGDAFNHHGLVTCKREPYRVSFVGNFSQQYSYDLILKQDQLERDAFRYHVEWFSVEKKIRDDILNHDQISNSDFTWDDAEFYGADGTLNQEKLYENIISSAGSYLNFEYFRQSSISKLVHKQAVDGYFECLTPKEGFLCQCSQCQNRRKTEHMRWNAYMRVNGYQHMTDQQAGCLKCHRAKVHPDLIPWQDLSLKERLKD